MSTCNTEHEIFASILTFGLIFGLVASYVPQHYKIISMGHSEGFSPWFLLLGATSSAAAMLNMYTLQWEVIKCCRKVSAITCLESIGGIFQVSLQWAFFSLIFILFMIYYPPHLKYVKVSADPNRHPIPTNVKSKEWRLSIVLAWATSAHLILSIIYTAFLVLSTKSLPGGQYPTQQIQLWATFLGVTSAGAAVIQYLPQLWKTYNAGLVGALSIPMMCVQSPGAGVMVLSIALREGTNWTSWAMYAASGIMQAMLLVMCLFWKARQRRLGIDDFGKPIDKSSVLTDNSEILSTGLARERETHEGNVDEETPLLQRSQSETTITSQPRKWWQMWRRDD